MKQDRSLKKIRIVGAVGCWFVLWFATVGQSGCPATEPAAQAQKTPLQPLMFDSLGFEINADNLPWGQLEITTQPGAPVPRSLSMDVNNLAGGLQTPFPDPGSQGQNPDPIVFFFDHSTTSLPGLGIPAHREDNNNVRLYDNQRGGAFDSNDHGFVSAFGSSASLFNPASVVEGRVLRQGTIHVTLLPPIFTQIFGSGDATIFVDQGSGNNSSSVMGAQQGGPVVRTLFVPGNAVVLPHVPFGRATQPGVFDLNVTTQIVINNPFDGPADVDLDFFDRAGPPLEVTIDGTTATRHRVTVEANSSRLVEVSSEGDLKIAWVLADRSQRVQMSVNFLTEDLLNGSFFEAGIASAKTSFFHVLNVNKTTNGFGTSIIAVNPTGQSANMRITLKSGAAPGPVLTADGTIQAFQTTLNQLEATLGAGMQAAKFFDTELFPSDVPQGEDFQGTVVIESDTSLAISSLKTINSVQSSSLPSGTKFP